MPAVDDAQRPVQLAACQPQGAEPGGARRSRGGLVSGVQEQSGLRHRKRHRQAALRFRAVDEESRIGVSLAFRGEETHEAFQAGQFPGRGIGVQPFAGAVCEEGFQIPPFAAVETPAAPGQKPGYLAQIGTYIGYLTPYATSHDDLDKDADVQEDVANAARALVQAVKMLRRGELKQPDDGLHPSRPK